MREIVSCRTTPEEKLLLQALAARRGLCVAHLVHGVLLSEIRKGFGPGGTAEQDLAA